ncbi:hypothetical protein [Henriciella litoralis]|uniref:hypothetical protein n=1 Tax=Henriciella litoralis TaxID=568102 RepID=UPI000A0569DD|nr:hypothetical protein [Henriciella litoralis]
MKGDLRTLTQRADCIALAADHFTARAYQELIDAMDAVEGDPDFEPSLGAHICDSQEGWADNNRDDVEHDPAELGELTESGFQNEAPWQLYTALFGGVVDQEGNCV